MYSLILKAKGVMVFIFRVEQCKWKRFCSSIGYTCLNKEKPNVNKRNAVNMVVYKKFDMSWIMNAEKEKKKGFGMKKMVLMSLYQRSQSIQHQSSAIPPSNPCCMPLVVIPLASKDSCENTKRGYDTTWVNTMQYK